ncbi:MAG: type II and III secretion system protein [Treponemataceae bacterium]|nr:type II and III secretion system protein [Treponemataceae bacterium]
MKMKHSICSLVMLLMGTVFLWAQNSYDFVNQDVTEIVYALSLARNFPIVCDDTVQGNGSFRYSGGSFDTAFDSFLLANRLYVTKEKDRWVISRLKVTCDDRGHVAVDACDVLPERIFEQLSLESEQVVVWESVPSVPVSIHTANVTAAEACSQILSRFSGYTVEDRGATVQVKLAVDSFGAFLSETVTASEPVQLTAGKKGLYSGTLRSATFDQLCTALKDAGGVEYSLQIPGYTPVPDCSFENRTLSWCLDLFCESAGVSWYRDGDLYVICEKIPFPTIPFVITLQSVSADRFLERLPAGYDRQLFTRAGSDYRLFFSGSKALYEQLESLIPSIDIPEERISYDLLIIQTQKNQSSSFGLTSLSSAESAAGTIETSVEITPGLQFNIDVPSLFGIAFSQKLEAAITENQAEIFADTTLYGISGIPMSFRNTNTYRYRDPYFSAESGSRVDTGITREIVSGLVLEVTGTVSGDGSVTTEVTASFSRQGIQDAAAKGNPPPTSEKIITTRVRGKSGEIIVLSGLVQDDSSDSGTRPPLISKIPLIGKLFGQREKTAEKNEMVIYLVPHVDDREGTV